MEAQNQGSGKDDPGQLANPLTKQVDGNHYKRVKIQPIEYIHANNLGFAEGNVIKYVTRHKFKGGRKDIEKAIHFLELLLHLEYNDANN